MFSCSLLLENYKCKVTDEFDCTEGKIDKIKVQKRGSLYAYLHEELERVGVRETAWNCSAEDCKVNNPIRLRWTDYTEKSVISFRFGHEVS